jgi:hypothetical protein
MVAEQLLDAAEAIAYLHRLLAEGPSPVAGAVLQELQTENREEPAKTLPVP